MQKRTAVAPEQAQPSAEPQTAGDPRATLAASVHNGKAIAQFLRSQVPTESPSADATEFSGISKSLIAQLLDVAYPESEFREIPKIIQFPYVGTPEFGKYIKDWAKNNPDWKINVWVDSDHLQAKDLSRTPLRRKMDELDGRSVEQRVVDNLHFLRNQAGKGKEAADDDNSPLHGIQRYLEYHEEELKTLEPSSQLRGADEAIYEMAKFAWRDRAGDEVRDPDNHERFKEAALAEIRERFAAHKNIVVRDIREKTLQNQFPYDLEMVNRCGAYPCAKDIFCYEAIADEGGINADDDIGSPRPLGTIRAHPNLMLVLLVTDREGGSTSYLQNSVIAGHPGSKLIKKAIDQIGENYRALLRDEAAMERYYRLASNSIVQMTGPNMIRGVIQDLLATMLEQEAKPFSSLAHRSKSVWPKSDYPAFWQFVDSKLTFPAEYVDYHTPEQDDSACVAVNL